MAAAGFRGGFLAFAAGIQGCSSSVTNVPAPLSTADIVQVPLESSPWHVASIGGRSTPPDESYSIHLRDAQFHAQFGCNSFNGAYVIRDGVLMVTGMIATTAGCLGPAGTFEHMGEAIIGLPMQIGMDPTTAGPVLFNGRGRINLVPLPPLNFSVLQGTWTVAEINGIATLGGERFQVRFTAHEIDGRFGCNRYNGEYRLEGRQFVALSGRRTEMACDLIEPHRLPTTLMDLEHQAFAVLDSHPEIELRAGGRIALVSAKGQIVLSRS